MLDHSYLKSRLEVRRVDEVRREITACNGRLLLGRYISLGEDQLRGVLSIDVVERREPSRPVSEVRLRDRSIIYEQLDPPSDLAEALSRIELVYYRDPSKVELISVRAYLKKEPTDEELVELYIRLLREFSGTYLDRTIKVVSKCQ